MKQFLILVVLFSTAFSLSAQDKYTISGHIKDKANGEDLIGATIYVKEIQSGTISNVYGFYSLTLPKGKYNLTYSYIGFEERHLSIDLSVNQTTNIELGATTLNVSEVIVKGERSNKNVENVEMSVAKLPIKKVKELPAFMGEVDILKSVQLLPGIQSGGEGSSGLYVRGGGPDQNLLQLDEAPVYNASHLMGFFSVFNSDAIKDMKVYKGGIPAQYGGRASAVLDIRMKDGNQKNFSATGGIGNLSSRLTIEGPIIKDKWSYIVSGRRTYADVIGKLAGIDELQENELYFYDLNGKTSFELNDKNRFFLSAYGGDDYLALGESLYMRWGNLTTTFRWNHLFSERLFSNFTVLYSKYDYNLGVPESGEESASFDWRTKNRDRSAKLDFTYYLNPDNTMKFGWYSIYHHFEPGRIKSGEGSFFNEFDTPHYNALEHALYVSNEQKIGGRLTLQYGLRFNLFQYVGLGQVITYEDEEHPSVDGILDTLYYESGEIIDNFPNLEPRLSLKYSLDDMSSLKMSYNRMTQNLHLITNTNSPTPFDMWVPTTKYIKPLIVDQVAIGYFRNFLSDEIETSAEIYYKDMQNVIDYKDGAILFMNDHLETEVLHGTGYSYGMEILVKKQEGNFTGWVGYTLSRTRRKIPGINKGREYPSSYDRTHDVSVVATYKLGDRWTFSGSWVYSTGNAASFPETKYLVQGITMKHFSDRNSYRIPDYHRLDLSVTFEPRKNQSRRWENSWNLSIYNVYSRRNAYSITFQENELNPTIMDAHRLSIIGAPIPAITYNFKF